MAKLAKNKLVQKIISMRDAFIACLEETKTLQNF